MVRAFWASDIEGYCESTPSHAAVICAYDFTSNMPISLRLIGLSQAHRAIPRFFNFHNSRPIALEDAPPRLTMTPAMRALTGWFLPFLLMCWSGCGSSGGGASLSPTASNSGGAGFNQARG